MRCLAPALAGLTFSLLTAAAPATPTGAEPLPLTDKGKRLAKRLDAFDVEHHWKSGEHITDWKTGASDGKKGGPKTHCSLFVAAVCSKLGVPMLDPPPQTFLSNRQQDWLLKQGKKDGWRRVRRPVQAQRLANEGVLVVASYKNPDPKKAGHIAVVRPAAVTPAEVHEGGPRITQAGQKNYRSTNVRTGFRFHPGAFENGEILYFAHQPKAE
jgi:hypothetical protein